MIVVPTSAPTATPTKTLVPTETPIPTATAVPGATSTQKVAGAEPQPTEMTSPSEVGGEVEGKSGSSLGQNWWIIVLAGLILAGAVGYWQLTKRKQAAKAEDQDLNSQQENKQD